MSAVRARFLLPLFSAAAVAVALCGCAKTEHAPATSDASASAWLAMARGQIDVEGGLVAIAASRDGRIDAVKVEDGDTVKQGDVLATLDPRQARIALSIAQANLAQARAQVDVLRAKLTPATQLAQRAGEAAAAGAASGQSADEATTNLAVLKSEIGAGDAAVAVARQHVDQAQAELDSLTLHAPVAGRIVRRSAHVGDVVSAQAATALFELLPDRPRIVRAELNEAYVDLVKPGMQAEVVRESGAGAAVQAEVLRVGDVFGPSRLTDDPIERAGVHDVDCVLRLSGGDFRIGQRVLVRFKKS